MIDYSPDKTPLDKFQLLAKSKMLRTEAAMNRAVVLKNIRRAIESSPRNAYVAELHLQSIKYADLLKDLSGREFCEAVGIGPSFGTEFLKMRKISERLLDAGLDVSKI